jgi:cold shock protein
MLQGKVKWFNNSKGFGFIIPDDSDQEIFAHFSQIKMDGYRSLKTGQRVEFDLVESEKGPQAQNINPLKKGN